MFQYFIVGADGKELPYVANSRREARTVKRDEEMYATDAAQEKWYEFASPLVLPLKIVRREYKLVEEKVVR